MDPGSSPGSSTEIDQVCPFYSGTTTPELGTLARGNSPGSRGVIWVFMSGEVPEGLGFALEEGDVLPVSLDIGSQHFVVIVEPDHDPSIVWKGLKAFLIAEALINGTLD